MTEQVIQLKASPSLQYQNLSFADGKFVYVHRNEAHVLNVGTKEPSSIQVKEKVHQARICNVGGQNVIVLATPGGTQFWDLGKEKCLFTVAHADEGNFLSRGIASTGSTVFVGSSTGTITLIEVKGDSGSVTKTVTEHKDGISDIAAGTLAGKPVVVSSDLAGEIIVWDPSGAVLARMEKSPGDTVTSIAITGQHVVCGYGSGKLRLFTENGKKVVEVAAHSRWVNAIDYHEKTNLLASASEDMVVQFWQMPSATDSKVALKSSKFLKDCLLTGVKFVSDGSKAGCAAYDTEKFYVVDC